MDEANRKAWKKAIKELGRDPDCDDLDLTDAVIAAEEMLKDRSTREKDLRRLFRGKPVCMMCLKVNRRCVCADANLLQQLSMRPVPSRATPAERQRRALVRSCAEKLSRVVPNLQDDGKRKKKKEKSINASQHYDPSGVAGRTPSPNYR
ncbi:hypothetical protein PTSG_09497 [Salpingoeca rosetta]|uniref:Uncharacterized protein n=1 Tax=Salpingoeca rosetta (strain ATCC 50818 / BSB-021) TaxID=946362 RepID=F2UL64_SALR5|nr:uncharacterized protein PTSG_09497 [Salpingoeca rosetta]EGD77863.1 hypothetical protein PTSG_09497 [Salpingoeca rosetta]|eukprot:XP_004989927.1 hypothetical protein PTSG_09497 [Salpingoeca rosetta]